MEPINYSNAAYPIRADFAAAHNRYWQRLAKAGAWLTGAQRVDVAKEVRRNDQGELVFAPKFGGCGDEEFKARD